MMQMFSFNFWFWFGFISSFPSRISPEIHLFYSDWTLCPYETCMLGSLGSSVVIHRIGHNSMMQMFSFNFWFWFGFRSTFPSPISPEIHLFYLDWTLCPYETCMLGSLGKSVVIQELDITLWCRCFLSISGFDLVSLSLFPSRWVLDITPEISIIFSDSGDTLSHIPCMLGSLGSSVLFTKMDISLWCRWDFQCSGFEVVLTYELTKLDIISMMQMFSFNFWVWWFQEHISFPN